MKSEMTKNEKKKLAIKKTNLREISPEMLDQVSGGLPGEYWCDTNATCTGTACAVSYYKTSNCCVMMM